MTPKTTDDDEQCSNKPGSDFASRRRNVPFSDVCVYETPNRYYLIGTGIHHGRKYCVLKIDRTETRKFVVSDGGHEYEREETEQLLGMIAQGNAQPQQNPEPNKSAAKSSQDSSQNAPILKARGAGIAGFIRFTEGFYMILVTRFSEVAQLGFHKILKVEETATFYIPNEVGGSKSSGGQNSADEQRYLRTFQLVDLTENIYFSYTYDLSRSFQVYLKCLKYSKTLFTSSLSFDLFPMT